jgi:hypothetical protein
MILKIIMATALAAAFAACDVVANHAAKSSRSLNATRSDAGVTFGRGVCDDPTWKCGRHGN